MYHIIFEGIITNDNKILLSLFRKFIVNKVRILDCSQLCVLCKRRVVLKRNEQTKTIRNRRQKKCLFRLKKCGNNSDIINELGCLQFLTYGKLETKYNRSFKTKNYQLEDLKIVHILNMDTVLLQWFYK